MAFSTYRNYVKPMLWGIAQMVMIFLRLFGAISTFQGIWSGKFSGPDSILYGLACFYSLWMSFFIVIIRVLPGDFAFFGLAIAIIYYFAFFCGVISQPRFAMNFFAGFCLLITRRALYKTHLAVITIAIWTICSFIKIGKWFNLVAFRALLCYDWFRHNVLSLKRMLCLEPSARPILVFGSSYYNNKQSLIKTYFQNF